VAQDGVLVQLVAAGQSLALILGVALQTEGLGAEEVDGGADLENERRGREGNRGRSRTIDSEGERRGGGGQWGGREKGEAEEENAASRWHGE
jgi:hypothetical protein